MENPIDEQKSVEQPNMASAQPPASSKAAENTYWPCGIVSLERIWADRAIPDHVPVSQWEDYALMQAFKTSDTLVGYEIEKGDKHVFWGDNPEKPDFAVTFAANSETFKNFQRAMKKEEGFRPYCGKSLVAGDSKPLTCSKVESSVEYVPLVSINLATAGLRAVPHKTIRSWVKNGKLPSEKRGRHLFVCPEAFQRLSHGRTESVPKGHRFYSICVAKGLHPTRVLNRILTGAIIPSRAELDLDIVHASFRIVMDGKSEFLDFLAGDAALATTFEGGLARMIGPDPDIKLSAGELPSPSSVENTVNNYKKEISDGCIVLNKQEYAPKVYHDFLALYQPKYLRDLDRTEIPLWARQSVATHRLKKDKLAYQVQTKAETDPKFREIFTSIVDRISLYTPTMNNSSANAERRDLATKDALSQERDLMKAEGIHFDWAIKYLWRIHNALHREKNSAVRNSNKPMAQREFASTLANRVFCAGRSVRVAI